MSDQTVQFWKGSSHYLATQRSTCFCMRICKIVLQKIIEIQISYILMEIVPENNVFNRSTCAFMIFHERKLPIISHRIEFSKNISIK